MRRKWNRAFRAAVAGALLMAGVSLTPTRYAQAAFYYCTAHTPAEGCNGWCWTTYCYKKATEADTWTDENGTTHTIIRWECDCLD